MGAIKSPPTVYFLFKFSIKMPRKGTRLRRQQAKAQAKALAAPTRMLHSSMASFGDNEPTGNKKELTIKVWDWIQFDYPVGTSGPGSDRIKTYALDLTQNFFAPEVTTANINETKNRIKSVTIECLSPFEPVTYLTAASEGETRITSTPLVLAACPVLADDTDGGSSIVGQISTVVHVDQRQAWIQVAHWDWHSIFNNSQLLPDYPSTTPEAVELFRFSVVDAITGLPIAYVQNQGDAKGLTFRVCVEIACPVTLVPNPTKYDGTAAVLLELGLHRPIRRTSALCSTNCSSLEMPFKFLGLFFYSSLASDCLVRRLSPL